MCTYIFSSGKFFLFACHWHFSLDLLSIIEERNKLSSKDAIIASAMRCVRMRAVRYAINYYYNGMFAIVHSVCLTSVVTHQLMCFPIIIAQHLANVRNLSSLGWIQFKKEYLMVPSFKAILSSNKNDFFLGMMYTHHHSAWFSKKQPHVL